MGFLSRRKAEYVDGALESREIAGEQIEYLRLAPDQVEEFVQAVYDRLAADEDSDYTKALCASGFPVMFDRSPEKLAKETWSTTAYIARMGYTARETEAELVEPAQTAGGLMVAFMHEELKGKEGSSTGEALVDFAAWIGKGKHSDTSKRSVTAMLPGLAPKTRIEVRESMISPFIKEQEPGGQVEGPEGPVEATMDELRHTWMYGYFLRASEEYYLNYMAAE
jgi:hypothetical protein